MEFLQKCIVRTCDFDNPSYDNCGILRDEKKQNACICHGCARSWTADIAYIKHAHVFFGFAFKPCAHTISHMCRNGIGDGCTYQRLNRKSAKEPQTSAALFVVLSDKHIIVT